MGATKEKNRRERKATEDQALYDGLGSECGGLLYAARLVLANWEHGDLANAVRELNEEVRKVMGRSRKPSVRDAAENLDQVVFRKSGG